MFYNMLARRRAFKPGPEEHNLLQDVLQRYAIYKAGSVGFTLKRQVRTIISVICCSKQANHILTAEKRFGAVQDG